MCDEIDPRIKVHLEKLNAATESINRYEFELQRTRNQFRDLYYDSSAKMESLRNRLGLCIERAKPYYEARYFANSSLKEVQKTTQQLEKAFSSHNAAKEMVSLAEQGIGNQVLDHAWQEMLNHAIQRVHETDSDRELAERELRFATLRHEAASVRVNNLQRDLKRSLIKSSLAIRRNLLSINSNVYKHQLICLPYYEMKAKFIEQIKKQKTKAESLKSDISNSKLQYSDTLKHLEEISEQIHRKREQIDFESSFEKLSLSSENLHFQSMPLSNQVFDNSSLLESKSHLGAFQSLIQFEDSQMDTSSELWSQVQIGDDHNDDQEEVSMTSLTSEAPKLKRRQSLDSVKDFLSYGVMKLNSNFNNVLVRRSSEPRFFDRQSSSGSFMKSFSFQRQNDDLSDTDSILSLNDLDDNQINNLMLESDLNEICQKIFGDDLMTDMS